MESRIFRYTCSACGKQNTATCKHCGAQYRFDPAFQAGEKRVVRHLKFGDRQWLKIQARAKLHGISASDYVRMACDDALSIPPERLIR